MKKKKSPISSDILLDYPIQHFPAFRNSGTTKCYSTSTIYHSRFKSPTCYDTPTTRYDAPTTCYNTPTTYNNTPTTCYNTPTCYNAPTTYNNIPTTYYNAPTTYNNIPTTCNASSACCGGSGTANECCYYSQEASIGANSETRRSCQLASGDRACAFCQTPNCTFKANCHNNNSTANQTANSNRSDQRTQTHQCSLHDTKSPRRCECGPEARCCRHNKDSDSCRCSKCSNPKAPTLQVKIGWRYCYFSCENGGQ